MINKKAIPVLLLTLVNTLGFSVLIPILPFIVERAGATEFVFGLLISAYSVFQFFGSPIIGQWSDRYGRRLLLLISQLGTLISWLIFGLAWYLESMQVASFIPLIVIGLARSFDGLTGGNNSVASAYLSDVIPADKRTVYFGYVGAMTGLGMIIGPAIGALTGSGSIGYLGTVIFSVILSSITLASIWLFLPEPERHKHLSENRSIGSRLNVFKNLIRVSKNKKIRHILQGRLFVSIPMAAYTSTITLLLIDLFLMNEKQLGNFLFFVGTFIIFNQAVLVKWFTKKIGEGRLLPMGLFLMGFGIITFPMMRHLGWFILFYYSSNLGLSLSLPTIKSLLSQYTPRDQQGDILGLDESLMALVMAITPAAAGLFYVYWGPYSFWIWGAFAIVGSIVMIISEPKMTLEGEL